MSEHIVTTAWLAEHLDSPDLAIIDASWHLPTAKRDAKSEFLESHIPGAQFFDIDENSDNSNPLPHMLPPPEIFASRMRKMGIGDGKRVIAYDSAGLFSAARAWWMFRVFGHNEVAVLDGGLPKWKVENRPLASGPAAIPQERHFTASYRAEMVRGLADVAMAVRHGNPQIADARSPSRFRADEPEPRPGLRAGHMPGARNVHYATLLNPDGTLQSAEEIKGRFDAAGIAIGKPVITSCGSGITAAILTLGLAIAGAPDHSLYDGSWVEWGSAPDTPVAIGP